MTTIYRNIRLSLFLFIWAMISSGCQIMPPPTEVPNNYAQYYLSLQSLNEQELLQEIAKQELAITQQNKPLLKDVAEIKMLFLFSLPRSPIYNSYRAKALLNTLEAEQKNHALLSISPTDQALISLLKDQLNQKLLMRNRLVEQQQQQQLLATQQTQLLAEQVQQLQQTIIQLKKIEQAISQREQ